MHSIELLDNNFCLVWVNLESSGSMDSARLLSARMMQTAELMQSKMEQTQ